ncbi:MAG TPA: sulfite exporter TauE/SafE family protein, partial [Spirochaetales bacterium]|nr:sulfite exporter TauE/SafE family protein [Spirochaetales bacterium]
LSEGIDAIRRYAFLQPVQDEYVMRNVKSIEYADVKGVLFNSSQAVIKKILASFIIVSAAIQLIKLLVLKTDRTVLPRWAGYLLLFAGGIVHGMFSSGGPFVVLYASGAIKDKSQFRASLCVLWSTLNTIIIVTYILKGRFSMQSFIDLGAAIPFLIGGIIIGEALHHKVNARTFSIIVFSMLLATGIIMIL